MNAMTNASKKILIADDDASIRLVLSQAFTRLGYQVRATGNATTLLKWVSDGEGDLVVMSMAAYERQQARLELYAKLLEAQEEERQGMPMVSHAEMMKRLRSRVKHAG